MLYRRNPDGYNLVLKEANDDTETAEVTDAIQDTVTIESAPFLYESTIPVPADAYVVIEDCDHIVHPPVHNPVHTPVYNPVNTPVYNPVHTPVHNPVNTPVHNPVNTHVHNPVNTPVPTPVQSHTPVVASLNELVTPRRPMQENSSQSPQVFSNLLRKRNLSYPGTII